MLHDTTCPQPLTHLQHSGLHPSCSSSSTGDLANSTHREIHLSSNPKPHTTKRKAKMMAKTRHTPTSPLYANPPPVPPQQGATTTPMSPTRHLPTPTDIMSPPSNPSPLDQAWMPTAPSLTLHRAGSPPLVDSAHHRVGTLLHRQEGMRHRRAGMVLRRLPIRLLQGMCCLRSMLAHE
jgi:hypothetical protein